MSNRIFILVIPGIGTKEEGFADGLKKDLEKHTNRKSVSGNFEIIECYPFRESDIDKNQDDLFTRLDENNELGGMLSLRLPILKAFGDGVTFERNSSADDSPYKKTHRYLLGILEGVNDKMKNYDKSKLIIVGSSMGVHVLSTYIWDADNSKGIFIDANATPNNNLTNLDYLATIGCNIPLFVSGLDESKINAFAKRNDNFVWDNFYDQDDVLGWPLKQLSPSYNNLVNDFEINTGLYVGSHTKYWDDNDFTKPLARKLDDIYNLM